MWQKTRITNYIKGRDGEVCGVKLLAINPKLTRVELNKPSQFFIALEIVNKNFNSKNNADIIQRKRLKMTVSRKRRVTARNADIIRRLMGN